MTEIFSHTFPYNIWIYPFTLVFATMIAYLAGLVWPGVILIAIDTVEGPLSPAHHQ